MKKRNIIITFVCLIVAFSMIYILSIHSTDDEIVNSETNTEGNIEHDILQEELIEDESIEDVLTENEPEKENEEVVEEEVVEEEVVEEPTVVDTSYFQGYEEKPTSCSTYEDVVYILCYMLLNDIPEFEISVIDFYTVDGNVQMITEEDVVLAYKDVSLSYSMYTDFWSKLSADSMEVSDKDGNIISINYTFVLSNKYEVEAEDLIDNIESMESFAALLMESMYSEGTLSDEMTYEEKAYVLYQWMGENIAYSYDSLEAEEYEVKKDNAYECLINGEAVCQGISSAYVYLCRLAGVPMSIQLGYTDGTAHSWCKIEVDGIWMYVDPTWGLTGAKDGEIYTDTWFWVTQEFMEEQTTGGREFVEYM